MEGGRSETISNQELQKEEPNQCDVDADNDGPSKFLIGEYLLTFALSMVQRFR